MDRWIRWDFSDALVYGKNYIAQTFTLTNNGVGPLSLASVTIDDETSYELIFDDLSDLAQGASRSGEVRFLPTLEGTNNSDLTIYFESGVPPVSLSLTGNGVVGSFSVSNTSAPFTFQGDARTWDVTLTNNTSVTLPVTGIF